MDIITGLDKETLSELVACHTRIVDEEKKLKKLKETVKAAMQKNNIWSINHDGKIVSLTASNRVTPDKGILGMLTARGLTNCMKTEIVADIDRLSMEIGNSITQEEYNAMVKTTQVMTMNIK